MQVVDGLRIIFLRIYRATARFTPLLYPLYVRSGQNDGIGPDLSVETARQRTKQPSRHQQLKALKEYHLAQCRLPEPAEARSPDEASSAARDDRYHYPLTQKGARSHWFEYNPPAAPPVLPQPEHQGKKYKVASDTWCRLDSAMTEMRRLREAARLRPYQQKVQKIPQDLW